MTNSRAATGNIELLDNHLATGTESEYVYTPSVALNMITKYREIFVIITGKATATLTLNALTNANTDYDYNFIKNDSTTLSGTVTAAATEINLLQSTLIDGAVSFQIKITIWFNNASDHLCGESSGSPAHEGSTEMFFEDQSTDTTITSIKIITSTSTWIAGTEITTYGLLR